MDSLWETVPEPTLTRLGSWLSAGAMMFGGMVPYVPQYKEIQKSKNADGFSSFVCLALLIANTLRIIFWFGHPFELPLLVQSVVMTLCMLALMKLCVNTKNLSLIIPAPCHTFTDFKWHHFWAWTDFLSYLEFLVTFAFLSGAFLYFFLDVPLVVEAVGFVALLTEALLGVPQLIRNMQNGSTTGMSVKMVLLWLCGDVFKVCYFVLRDAPPQFWICGTLQVSVDCAILGQVVWYGQHRRGPRLLKAPVHTS